MKFRTEISLPDEGVKINHRDKIVTIGSCFAENIGSYFSEFRFNVLKNPFGVLYNPVSILNSLKIVEAGVQFGREDLILDQSEYHSFYFHSDFSSHNADECLNRINATLQNTGDFLKETNVIIITLGTSFVYRHLKKNIIVSNCHKISPKEFEMTMLSPGETRSAINDIIKIIRNFNNEIKILFTVSPIRHWKNGAVKNQLSKSNLIVAIHEAIQKNNNIYYFPSYEIMMDDLRDYRFYEADLLHPNKIATDYIWEKFISAYLTDETKLIMERIDKIQKAASHKPRNINSLQHQEFLREQITKLENLLRECPYLNLSDIQDIFKSRIR